MAEQTCRDYGDTNITFMVTSTFENYHSGILQLQMRSDVNIIRCIGFKWLSRIGFDINNFVIVINGMTWTLYAYQPVAQYGRIAFEILSMSNDSSKDMSWALNFADNNTKETTAPVATVTSSDGASINAMDITTTIDSTSTNTQVPGAKSVWDSLYKIRDPQVLVDANKPTSRICEADLTTLNTPAKEGLTNGESSLIISVKNQDFWNGQISITMAESEVFVRSVRNVGTWTKWRKLCTTSVKDIPKTVITFTDETYFKNADSNNDYSSYYVQNGVCYMSVYIRCVSQKSSGISYCTSDVPKPKHSIRKIITPWDITGTQNKSVFLSLESHMTSLGLMGGQVGADYLLQFSYPVSES